ncbi:expressed unknown protein [Seminavis robusta]|uniref:Uncharacterized protein n=1 Tax=Seminavis robusta TaxID=568900 RepID=A0A9N8EM73_9STRA|nr:expressed unknown protein [Seminavis robusta]|eukprot:Sro1242_g255490.1 n/a (157) ;mRNA; f:7461-7931
MALLATVKETGVNDVGLLTFYKTFFQRYPVYQDEKWQLYHAMGGRKVGPFKLMYKLIKAQGRYFKKGFWHSPRNVKVLRSPWMTGGVLVFNKKGELTYALEESVGKPFDMERLQAAIEETRDQQRTSSRKSHSSKSSSEEIPAAISEQYHHGDGFQ